MVTCNYMNYIEYINCADGEERQVIDKLFKQCILENKGLDKVKQLEKRVNILVITSTKCKDSATIVPFLIKLKELNDKIEINFLLKKDNEELLEKLTNESRVPTFLILDSRNNVLRKFIEFPRGVKEILRNSSVEMTQDIIDKMRNGKYNELIQEDLIRFITGEEYEYITFVRKDT